MTAGGIEPPRAESRSFGDPIVYTPPKGAVFLLILYHILEKINLLSYAIYEAFKLFKQLPTTKRIVQIFECR